MSEPSSENTHNANNSKICVLMSDFCPTIKHVLLDKEPLTLGRFDLDTFFDPRVSKKQMKFEADYSTDRVLIEQLGINSSAINEQSMVKGEKRYLYHGDKVSLIKDKFTYSLNFASTPSYGIESNKRPTHSLELISSLKKNRLNVAAIWETRDDTLLVYNSSDLIHKNKVAAFELDGTIIITAQSGDTFAIDYTFWRFFSSEVTQIIKNLADDDYKIVIFSNQYHIGSNNEGQKTLKKKIENIVNMIKTPVQLFIATESDIYRKPAPGMWNTFVSDYNGGLSIDMQRSFFCGDGAGRSARTNVYGEQMKKDHTCYDRLFAMNIGLKFYTPEEYFWKGRPEEFKLPIFNPNDVMTNIKYTDLPSKLFSDKQEMIILVGSPGSGKSHFVSNELKCHGYIKIINTDIFDSCKKYDDFKKGYLKKKYDSVVIDDTNSDIESRKRFIDLAKSLNIQCRVFLMNISKEHAKHNIKEKQKYYFQF